MGLLVISDDVPELLYVCHRILLMKKRPHRSRVHTRPGDGGGPVPGINRGIETSFLAEIRFLRKQGDHA